MSLAVTIEAMIAHGCTLEQVAAVARANREAEEAASPARTARQERNARYYAKRLNKRLKTPEPSESSESKGVPDGSNDSITLTSLTSPNTSLRSEISRVRARFVEFKSAYPRRHGSQPWQPAEKKFEAVCKSGVDPAEIVAGVRAYAAAMAGDDPKFVAQAVTWLNQGRWRDEHVAPPPRPPPGAGKSNGSAAFTRKILQEIEDERER